jgi:hypothetical protein
MKYINNLDMHAEKDDEQWILVCYGEIDDGDGEIDGGGEDCR